MLSKTENCIMAYGSIQLKLKDFVLPGESAEAERHLCPCFSKAIAFFGLIGNPLFSIVLDPRVKFTRLRRRQRRPVPEDDNILTLYTDTNYKVLRLLA